MKKIHFFPDDIEISVKVGSTVSEALEAAGISITHPCGKKGTCGRCLVYIDEKPVLACATCVDKDVDVFVPDSVRTSGQKVLTDISYYNKDENELPLVEKIHIVVEPPTLDDSTSDVKRVTARISHITGFDEQLIWFEPSVLTVLPDKLRNNDFNINIIVYYEKNGITVIDIADNIYGVAVDIGTTTIACALSDLQTGEVLETIGVANPQAVHGSDVISRIIFTEENENGTDILRSLVVNSLSDCIQALAEKRGLTANDISVVTIAGNTVMSHFLLGLKTDYVRREPYVPVANDYPIMSPGQVGLCMLKSGRVIVLPSVSSYVGGDIVAGVIATNISSQEGTNLLVDVGTNGEMVLAGEGFMIACSCSAGPAFEGSGISCGSRAVEGAINNVEFKNGKLEFDVIGEKEAKSVCGSGLISLISALHEAGIINRQGKFVGGENVYNLTNDLTIEEADILNLIRAKGAIFAGMRVLLNSMELSFMELDHIYIAGGFGKSLNVDNAISIGMLPTIKDKANYFYIGNSSLAGALRALNDRTIDIKGVAEAIMNFELSIGNEFMDEFMMACFLPHTDLSLFN